MTTFGRIQWRRDQGADWTSVNPILLSGEVGFNLDNGLFKIGDGETEWNGLPYFGASNEFAALLVWDAITSKPAYVAAGPTAAAARAAIGAAGTDQLAQAIADLVGASPEHLDTLKELGDALGEADADLTDLLALVGTKQAGSAELTALAGLTGNDQMAYRNASGVWVTAPITSFGRAFLALADATAARTALGLVIGTHVQAYSADLANLVTLLQAMSGSSTQMLAYTWSTDTWSAIPSSGWGRSFLAVASAGAANNALIPTINPVNSGATVSYTLALTDAQNVITTNNAAANKVMIPTNLALAIPVGSVFTGIQLGAGATTYEAVTPGTTTVLADGGKLKHAGQNTMASVMKIATDTWLATGALIV